jgi:hypothetical protein
MGADVVVILPPFAQYDSRMRETAEQMLIQHSSRILPLRLSVKPFSDGLPGVM